MVSIALPRTGEGAMKVVVNSPKVELPPGDRSAKKATPNGLTSSPGTMQDRATLSTGTLSVRSLAAQALNSPQTRQAKVDALGALVQKGEYKPNVAGTINAIASSENM